MTLALSCWEPSGRATRQRDYAALLISLHRVPVAVSIGASPTARGARCEGDGREEKADYVFLMQLKVAPLPGTLTRKVYIHEVKSAERTARLRAKMEARYAAAL